jgi:hypothetical protein
LSRFADLPNWNFIIDEVSLDVYKINGKNEIYGGNLEITGFDPEELLRQAREIAAEMDLKTHKERELKVSSETYPIGLTMPDVTIKIRFKRSAEGGRQANVEIALIPYGCPLVVDGEAFDCRVLQKERVLELGKTYELPVKFLLPDLVLPKLSLGKQISLWEGKETASGSVIRFG